LLAESNAAFDKIDWFIELIVIYAHGFEQQRVGLENRDGFFNFNRSYTGLFNPMKDFIYALLETSTEFRWITVSKEGLELRLSNVV